MNNNEIQPNRTLYIKNLNEKLKIDDLKSTLNDLFSNFGDVIDIRAKHNIRLKGQAFITFQTIDQAELALKTLNNQNFFGKRLVINYAKTTSEYALLQLGEISLEDKNIKDLQRKRKRDEYYQIHKKVKIVDTPEISDIPKKNNIVNNKKEVKEILNNILFVQGLNEEITQQMIVNEFNKYEGYVECRYFPARGICFIEYKNEDYAKKAKDVLNDKTIGNCKISIEYSKK